MIPSSPEIWNVVAGCFLIAVVAGIGLHTLVQRQRGADLARVARPLVARIQASAATAQEPATPSPDPAQAHVEAFREVMAEVVQAIKADLKAEHRVRIRKAVADAAGEPPAVPKGPDRP